MKRATREWVKKAEADYRGAKKLVRTKPPVHELVCFHCQQTAEKYLKALLEELGLAIAKTHSLDQLLTILWSHHPTLRSIRRGLRFLTPFAVDIRYPGHGTTAREAAAATRWVDRIRTLARTLLGLRVRGRK
jgi:HEPN domain-containing protein